MLHVCPQCISVLRYISLRRESTRRGRLQVDKSWSSRAARPYDPHLTELGEQQARAVAADLKRFDLKRVYVSPFLRRAHFVLGPLSKMQGRRTRALCLTFGF